jgi:hypothetical protein
MRLDTMAEAQQMAEVIAFLMGWFRDSKIRRWLIMAPWAWRHIAGADPA